MKVDSIPTLDLSENMSFARDVISALESCGAFQLKAPSLFSEQVGIIERAGELFSLSHELKCQYQIDRLSSYTGYSMLSNERDFREQYHIFHGFESKLEDSFDRCSHLKAPNKVPEALSDSWTVSVSHYIEEMIKLSAHILKPVEEAIGLPGAFEISKNGSSYSLLKMINYLPVTKKKNALRMGAPPHIDWSWLTIVMQDGNPGLSLLMPDGTWHEFTLSSQCFLVFAGELLELSSRGRFRAQPHKVTMHEGIESRISAPFFYSPDLDSSIKLACDSLVASRVNEPAEHIHRVFKTEEVHGDFHFGASELMRKQYFRWCEQMECCN